MIGFTIAAVLMLAAALVLLLPPLFRQPGDRPVKRDALNVALYKDRLAELEAEREDGRIAESDFERARSELQQDLLANVEEGAPQPKPPEGGQWLPMVIAAAVPVFTIAFYLPLGSPDLIAAEAPAPGRPAQQAESGMPSVDQALADLEARLEAEPENPDGWMLLGRSLMATGDYRKAADVFARAMRELGESPDLMLGRAQALAQAAGSLLAGEPISLVRRVLESEPANPEALWLDGVYRFEKGEFEAAIERWQRVRPQLGEGSEMRRTIDSAIAQAQSRLEGAAPAAAAQAPGAASSAELRIQVSLAPEFADHVAPDDTLFVFARAPGMRMPVAVERHRAAELPLSIALDDSSSMTGRPLGSFDQLEVVARVSKSGSVRAASGDLEGGTTTSPHSSVAITIDRQLP